MTAATNQTELDPIAKATLQLAQAVAELRRLLPINHTLQSRLAAMATEVTQIAREVDRQ